MHAPQTWEKTPQNQFFFKKVDFVFILRRKIPKNSERRQNLQQYMAHDITMEDRREGKTHVC